MKKPKWVIKGHTWNPILYWVRRNYYKQSFPSLFLNEDEDYLEQGLWGTGGSSAHVLGFPVYGSNYRGVKLVKWLHYNILRPYDTFRRNLHYRFKVRPHILKIQNIRSYTWTDADERMFHACFSILGQYVEEELGPYKRNEDNIEWHGEDYYGYRGYREHSVGNDQPLIDLWIWYKIDLPKEEYAYDIYLSKKNYRHKFTKEDGLKVIQITSEKLPEDEKYEGTEYIETLKDKKLKELIELRQTMWT